MLQKREKLMSIDIENCLPRVFKIRRISTVLVSGVTLENTNDIQTSGLNPERRQSLRSLSFSSGGHTGGMSPLPPVLLSTYVFFKTQWLCPQSVYTTHCVSRQCQTAVSIVLVRGLFLKNGVQLETAIYRSRGIPELLGLCTQQQFDLCHRVLV